MELSFTFRGRVFRVSIGRDSSLKELGEQLQALTGADPETIKLLLPHGVALMPFSAENLARRIGECELAEGRIIRMMGASSQELVQVSEASRSQRVIGFEEEERRARQRTAPAAGSVKLPQGPYVFGGFRTLELPGVQMSPPPSKALELMHTLASDPGIVAIMNKHRWQVGIMTEMAPEGLVGISPKCLLGFNKNHGEEISLRLRTDDLRGFRKYESIKKTLLHELAHMVFGEHDDDFYRLDRQLNKEALELDWTRSQKRTLSSTTHHFEQQPEEASASTGYRLGGSGPQNVKLAAANAAISRFEKNNVARTEPDPDDEVMGVSRAEPDPDDELMSVPRVEPDPDDELMSVPRAEPDPDDELMSVPRAEPDPDDSETEGERDAGAEPDPDEDVMNVSRAEPDPDDSEHEMIEPDPDEKLVVEPDPDDDESHPQSSEPDPDERAMVEPDPDDEESRPQRLEPDPDDDESKFQNSGDAMGLELGRIQDATTAANTRLQELIRKLKVEASPLEVVIVFQTLVKILSNVMEHPNEAKYKTLKKSNPLFQERVGRFEGALDLLKMVGFTEEAKEFFVLKNNDPGLLWLARSSLEASA